MRHLPCYLILSLFLSCVSNQERELDNILNFAGDNRLELEKVLTHYQHDTLKLKAARFLILNMPGHGTYAGKNTARFYSGQDSILASVGNGDSCKILINELITQANALGDLKWQEDIQSIKSDFLIANIDQSFEVWQKEPYAKQLTFDDFCEFILPYRINNEPLEYWRDSIAPYYNDTKNEGYYEGSEFSTFLACKQINESLRQEYRPMLANDNWPLTRKYSDMKRMHYGKCFDYAVQAAFVMRAKGIPVMIDYTPQWPFRSLGHTWNVVKLNNGNNATFGGIDGAPDDQRKPVVKMAKVYRTTYAPNKNAPIYFKEPIPTELRSPFYKDVTAEYFTGTDITIPILFEPSVKRQLLYLHLFNNQEWIPICHSERKGGKVQFAKMGRDIMYLPAYFVNGKPEPANYPFLLDLQGNTHFYQPDLDKLKTVKLSRKFPFNNSQRYSSKRMVGGKIEGADNSEFKNVQTIFTITDDPIGKYVKVKINPEGKKFRFWRYISPSYANGNIAELEFYRKDSLCNQEGSIIGTAGSHDNDPGRAKESAFDGNPLTFFDTPTDIEKGAWVGMDFKNPVSIDEVAYIPRSDDNNVSPGDNYELLYYGEDGWVSLGQKIATDYHITYDSVPDNALLWLRDLTKGAEERIFTCENDWIRWW